MLTDRSEVIAFCREEAWRRLNLFERRVQLYCLLVYLLSPPFTPQGAVDFMEDLTEAEIPLVEEQLLSGLWDPALEEVLKRWPDWLLRR